MSDGLNKVFIGGNIAAEPELRATQNSSVLNFRVACSESYKDRDGQRKERTEYVTCVLWGARADALSKILRKGMQVFCEGSLRTETYEKQGERRYATKVNVTNVILGARASGGERDGSQPRTRERVVEREAYGPPAEDTAGYGGDDGPPF